MQAQVNWQRQLNAKASCSTPSLAVRTASSKQVVAHLTWLRRGGADKDPASPFACLHLTTDRQVGWRRKPCCLVLVFLSNMQAVLYGGFVWQALHTCFQVSHRRYKALGKDVSEQSVEDWHRIFEVCDWKKLEDHLLLKLLLVFEPRVLS
jgi:hypothetical protein